MMKIHSRALCTIQPMGNVKSKEVPTYLYAWTCDKPEREPHVSSVLTYWDCIVPHTSFLLGNSFLLIGVEDDLCGEVLCTTMNSFPKHEKGTRVNLLNWDPSFVSISLDT